MGVAKTNKQEFDSRERQVIIEEVRQEAVLEPAVRQDVTFQTSHQETFLSEKVKEPIGRVKTREFDAPIRDSQQHQITRTETHKQDKDVTPFPKDRR